MPQLEWTEQTPTEPGYYWVDLPAPPGMPKEPYMGKVIERNGLFYVEIAITGGTVTTMGVKKTDARWAGPIEMPPVADEPEPNPEQFRTGTRLDDL